MSRNLILQDCIFLNELTASSIALTNLEINGCLQKKTTIFPNEIKAENSRIWYIISHLVFY